MQLNMIEIVEERSFIERERKKKQETVFRCTHTQKNIYGKWFMRLKHSAESIHIINECVMPYTVKSEKCLDSICVSVVCFIFPPLSFSLSPSILFHPLCRFGSRWILESLYPHICFTIFRRFPYYTYSLWKKNS